jgi:hypothetical protein
MSVFDGEAFWDHCHRLTDLCPGLPFAADLDWSEGTARRSIEELQRIRDALLAVGAPTPPAGFPMRIPRAAPGAEGVNLRPCDSPELWKVELLQAVRDAVASHLALQERSCALARDRPKAMQEAQRLTNEGNNGWLGYTAFEQEMNKEIGRLRGNALVAQERLFEFKCQLEEMDARERDAAREVRLKGGAATVAHEKTAIEPTPKVAAEMPPGAREEWLPAARAVELAQRADLSVTLDWLSRRSRRSGVRTRPRELPGNHQLEVDWYSLAGYLAKKKAEQTDTDDLGSTERAAIEARMKKATEGKRRGRPLQ